MSHQFDICCLCLLGKHASFVTYAYIEASHRSLDSFIQFISSHLSPALFQQNTYLSYHAANIYHRLIPLKAVHLRMQTKSQKHTTAGIR
jgi:hypothetical protein